MTYISRFIRMGIHMLSLTVVFGSASLCSAQQSAAVCKPEIDFSLDVRYFGGGPTIYPWPDLALFRDRINNRIMNAAISGVTRSDLETAGIADAGSRLDALVKGQCLRIEREMYRVSFPVMLCESREAIRTLVDTAAASVTPRVSEMVTRLERAAPGRREALFHLLWSRAMDNFWWPAWGILHGKTKNMTDGLPSVAYILSPDHSRQVGTNYNDLPGSGEIAITWSSRARSYVRPINELRAELERIAWGLKPSAPGKLDSLRAAGCIDEEGRVRPFVFHNGDKLDELLKKTSKEYAALTAKLYDYDALASRFGVAPGQLFVILQHETAYAVYDMLTAQEKLVFPAALDGEGHPEACAQLVSLRLKKRPRQ
jgi:hypothetical protein